MNKTYFDERLHKVVKDATYSIQDYIEEYRNKNDYLDRLKFILLAVISSVIETSEVRGDFASEYIWSELENMAKEGGLTAVAEKIQSGRTYSISEIDPQDVGSGMNYLGQHVATALYKHIHDLPVQQRKPEMFLRALESVITNLLNQKFADYDQHKIIDSLCEHLHMALDDKASWDSKTKKSSLKVATPEQEKVKPRPTTKSEQPTQQADIKSVVIKINQQVLAILASGGQSALISELPNFIADLDKIMHHESKDEINDLCGEFHGFYQLMGIIEALASDLSSGKIKIN